MALDEQALNELDELSQMMEEQAHLEQNSSQMTSMVQQQVNCWIFKDLNFRAKF